MGKKLTAVLALIAGCGFGLGGAMSQIIKAQGYEIIQIMLSQCFFAVVILGILVAVKYKYSISARDTIKLIGVGLISLGSYISYLFAIDLLSVGATIAIQFQYVWIVIMFSSIAARALPGKWMTISAALVIFGSMLGSGLADEFIAGQVTMNPLGLLLALSCALCYAGFIFLNSRVAIEHHPLQRVFAQMSGSLIGTVIAYVLMGVGPCDFIGLAPWGLAMCLISSIVPTVFIAIASARLESGFVSILVSSELPAGVFAGFLLLHETVTPLEVVGIVIILGAMTLQSVLGDGGSNAKRRSPLEQST